MTDGIESFEVTDWDLENEFNPNRVKHQLTKKQQIYGVFASDDSDDDVRPSFGSKGDSLTSGIAFISGGVRVVGEKDETKKASDQESVSSSDEAPVKPKPSFQRQRANQRSGFSGIHKPHVMAGLRSFSEKDTGSQFGGWEKYTKGIGQKLLLQMGYEPGKGLGKKLQGITTPIEAKLRKGKGAIGLYGPECSMKRVNEGLQAKSLESTEEDKAKVPHKRQWKKKDSEGQKVRYIYKTAEEVAEEGAKKKMRSGFSNLSSVKVIDMTGPQQRILSGYHQIHQQHSKPPEQEVESSEPKTSIGYHFSLPELEHNLSLLEDEEKKKIVRCEQQKRYASDRIVAYQQEQDRLQQVLLKEEKQTLTLQRVLNIIESLDQQTGTDESNVTLEYAARTFKELQEDYYEEYKLYNLSDLAITIVVPLAKKLLESWNPLIQFHHCIDVFKDWKELLEMSQSSMSWGKGAASEMDPYAHLVWDVWMPPVRQAVFKWEVRKWEPMLQLLESWLPLLPPWILNIILEQLILTRLQTEIDNWNPLTDTVPVHSWIHPWLPLMGTRLEPLYVPIRQKLSSALVNWHPSDCSAKLILEPWKAVFSPGVMDTFILKNILPKLKQALQTYIINPHQQHLDVWNWVMAWLDMIPEPSMITLLDKEFFPRWMQVLCTWLTHNPSYEEVTRWYTGWKSMLPASLLTSPVIKDKFKQAMDVMQQAVYSPQGLLGSQPGAKESMAYLANVERQQELAQHVKPRREYEAMFQTIPEKPTAKDLSVSFKNKIKAKASESNIVFMPVAGRYQQGNQVHRFGSSLLYLDGCVIFVYNEKTWVPTSLQSLLDMAG